MSARPGRLAALLQQAWAQPQPTLLARALQPLSWLYAGLAGAHRGLYRLGLRRRERAPVPVVVVGNLLAGGAGKTPTVIALVQTLRELGWRPGVISRGYGAQASAARKVSTTATAAEVGDEPLLIRRRTGAPVVVARRRIEAARVLCAAHPDVNVLVADDGLQHHALARDVQVIVFDERGAGNGLRLPAGPLREALPAELPPRTLVLYNAAAPTTALPGFRVQRQLGGVQPLADWWQGGDAGLQPVHALRGRALVAAAGLAHPQRFFTMLAEQGLTFTARPLPDHHDFATLPWPAATADVVLTEKDATKLTPERCGATRVWVARLDFHPEPAFGATLARLLAEPAPDPAHHEP